jgi:phage anti-repressor protein
VQEQDPAQVEDMVVAVDTAEDMDMVEVQDTDKVVAQHILEVQPVDTYIAVVQYC